MRWQLSGPHGAPRLDDRVRVTERFSVGGSATVSIEASDPDRDVINHQAVADRDLSVEVDGVRFVLVKVEKATERVVLTFEHEDVVALKSHEGEFATTDQTVSRSGWVRRLLTEAGATVGRVDESRGGHSFVRRDGETSWDAIRAAASNVGWWAFASHEGIVFVAPQNLDGDSETVRENARGIGTIHFDLDDGQDDKVWFWSYRPMTVGTEVSVVGLSALAGRWVVASTGRTTASSAVRVGLVRL